MLNRWIEEELLDVLGGDRRRLHRVLPAGAGHADRASTSTGSRRARARRRDSSLSPDLLTEKNIEHVRALNAMAGERGQSLAQMALAWALRDERVTSVLIGASSVAQLDDNLAALQTPALRRRGAQPASTSTPSTPGSTCGRARRGVTPSP